MINGAHVVIYSRDADADKAFIKDVLKFSYVDAFSCRAVERSGCTSRAMKDRDDAAPATDRGFDIC
jgi:hypothetical protein